MNEVMGRALEGLVRDVGSATPGPPDDLWRRGARRRQRARATTAAALAVVAALFVFAAWPAVSTAPAVPAARPPATTQPHTYPSMIAHPYFAPDASRAHRPMVAVVQSGGTAYAVDDKGDAWRLRIPELTTYAALSPDGRWVVDGRFVTDLVEGTRQPVPHPGAADDLHLWATWSPDSAYYARAIDPSGSIVVATPRGAEVPVPALAPDVRAGLETPVVAGWVDARTLLVAWSVPGATTLATSTWVVGARTWVQGPFLTFPKDVAVEQSALEAGVSPDGRTLVVAAAAHEAPGRYDSILVAFDVSRSAGPGGSVAGRPIALRTTSSIDGITWRRGELLVTVAGRTGPPGAAPVVTSGAGFSGLTSWRADALVGDPYWNSLAIWRARLVVLAGILLAVVAVWSSWRGALWAARRMGVIDGPLPYRLDLAWWRRA